MGQLNSVVLNRRVIVHVRNDFQLQSSALTLSVHFFYCDFGADALVLVDEVKLKVDRGKEANKTDASFHDAHF